MLKLKEEHIKDLESLGFEKYVSLGQTLYRYYLKTYDIKNNIEIFIDYDRQLRIIASNNENYDYEKETFGYLEEWVDLDLIYDLIMKGWVERV